MSRSLWCVASTALLAQGCFPGWLVLWLQNSLKTRTGTPLALYSHTVLSRYAINISRRACWSISGLHSASCYTSANCWCPAGAPEATPRLREQSQMFPLLCWICFLGSSKQSLAPPICSFIPSLLLSCLLCFPRSENENKTSVMHTIWKGLHLKKKKMFLRIAIKLHLIYFCSPPCNASHSSWLKWYLID